MTAHGFLLIVLMVAGAVPLTAQTQEYSPEVEGKIALVEKNLGGWVKTSATEAWTLAERMKKYRVHGVSIAVIHNFRLQWARGYGFADVSEHRPVTAQTLFQAASISKSLNSLGVLKLVDDKKLDLYADINQYLVTWKFPYDRNYHSRPITLADLLSHTAGLTIHGFPGYARGETLPTLPQILDGQSPANTGAIRSFAQPGQSVSYSGGGTTITQMIVMDVTQQPYDLYMRKNVLEPLGMTASSFSQPPPDDSRALLATGYKIDGTEVQGKYHNYPEQAAAGLRTTPTDLCKYIIDTQLAFKGESTTVLSPAMTRVRLTPVREDAGLGTFINSRVTGSTKYFNHNGGNAGFSCTAIGSLDVGNGVVIMTNSDNSALLDEIANSVATVYGWKDYYLPETKKVVDLEQAVLDQYVGHYDLEGRTVTIERSGVGLIINVGGDLFWNVYFTSENDFFMRENKGSLRFQFGEGKRVVGFSFNGGMIKKLE